MEIIGVPELRREISPINDILTFIKLYRIMRSNKYDIVHFHSSKMGILGRLAAYLAGVKNIYFTVHGMGALTNISQSGFRSYWGWPKHYAAKMYHVLMCFKIS